MPLNRGIFTPAHSLSELLQIKHKREVIMLIGLVICKALLVMAALSFVLLIAYTIYEWAEEKLSADAGNYRG